MMIPKLLQMQELLPNETFSFSSQPFSFKYLLLLAIFLILLRRWSSSANSSVPPSPPKLPIIGNLHQLGSLPHHSLQTLSQRHGPVMLLHFGSRPVVVLSSAEAASQIFKTHDLIFSDRPKFIYFEKVTYNYKDVVSAPYGEYWRQLRSISVLNLLSNKRVRSFRGVRQEEITLMISNILQSCSTISSSSSTSSSSTLVNLSDAFMKVSNDIICRVAMGRRYSDLGEDGGMKFMNIAGDLTEFFTRVNIGDYIPWLSWFTRLSGFDAELDDLAKRSDAFFDMVVQEHIDKPKTGLNDNNEDQKDFVDILLEVQKENAIGIQIDRVDIKGIILDMFAGGSDTTFTTLEWVMSELMKNPRAMKKLQNEVRGVVGNKGDITEDDLVGMHYLKAVIKETFRLHPPFPLLIPRLSKQDVKVNGYDIKANTQVMVNAWAIGRDPKSYTNPEQFEPERFLNSAIDYKGNDFELIPFGSGRRGCPGMNFAVIVVEIVLANVVHKFDWILPDGTTAEDLDMTETSGVTAHRKYPLKVAAKPYIS